MVVRRLRSNDAHLGFDALRRLKGTDGRLMSSVEYLSRFLATSENVLIVATDGDQPIGYVVAYLLDRVDGDQQMMLFYEIMVAESHRGRGIGKHMIAELKTVCRCERVMKMWVPTGRSNVAATRLYASTGAVPQSEDDVIYTYSPESFISTD